MAQASKMMIMGSIGASGLVALLSILDLAIGIPYRRMMIMDIMFILAAGIVIYLAWETYQDQR